MTIAEMYQLLFDRNVEVKYNLLDDDISNETRDKLVRELKFLSMEMERFEIYLLQTRESA